MEEDMEPAVKFASSCSFCCHDGQWTLCEFVCSRDGGCVLSLGFLAFELVSKSMSCLWQFAVFASLKSGLILQEHVVRSVALEGVLVIMRNSSVPLLFTFSHTCYFNRYSLSAWWEKWLFIQSWFIKIVQTRPSLWWSSGSFTIAYICTSLVYLVVVPPGEGGSAKATCPEVTNEFFCVLDCAFHFFCNNI